MDKVWRAAKDYATVLIFVSFLFAFWGGAFWLLRLFWFSVVCAEYVVCR